MDTSPTPASLVPSEVEGRWHGLGGAPLDFARDEREGKSGSPLPAQCINTDNDPA